MQLTSILQYNSILAHHRHTRLYDKPVADLLKYLVNTTFSSNPGTSLIMENWSLLFELIVFCYFIWLVLRSQWLLQMLISDDADTAHSALNLIQYAVRVNADVISSLDEKVLHSLLDEMVFKIVSGVDKYVAKWVSYVWLSAHQCVTKGSSFGDTYINY